MNISVLMLFFNRPDRLAKVFAEVKKAQPARLFLYQDGPRSAADMPQIEACRRVVELIDWPCEVHRLYQERNYGCDPSGYMSQRWAFSQTDKCIVLEDDCVPSQSFFRFCQEMLDRYADDPRVWMIAGFNAEEQWPTQQADYLFTRVFSIWGWASWSRVVSTWDDTFDWVAQTARYINGHGLRNDLLPMLRRHAASGVAHFESIFWGSMILHDALAIMPAQNLVNNIGVTDDSTHFSGTIATMPRRLRRQFTMARHELQWPLRHPTEVSEEPAFRRAVYLRNAWNNPCRKVQYSLEELWLNLRRGNFRTIFRAMRRRFFS